MNICEAAIDDLTAIVALSRSVQAKHAEAMPELFRGDFRDEEMRDAFRVQLDESRSHWLVAKEGDCILGYLSAEFRPREESWCAKARRICYLSGIAISPAHRRKGIAEALISSLKQEARVRKVAEMELDVYAFNNGAKEAFVKLGFHPVMVRMRADLDEEQSISR